MREIKYKTLNEVLTILEIPEFEEKILQANEDNSHLLDYVIIAKEVEKGKNIPFKEFFHHALEHIKDHKKLFRNILRIYNAFAIMQNKKEEYLELNKI